jgi:uncharacterized protein (DUF58 family)
MPPDASIADVPAVLRAVCHSDFLFKLQRFRISARQRSGLRPGNTPMPHGSQPNGLEIANHKAYAPGDDLRHFDWNAYGRLEQMLVKTFRAEREAPLHLFIDASASMAVPQTDGKLAFAVGIAASLAYVALRQHDPVRIVALSERGPFGTVSPLLRHPQRLPELQAFLSRIECRGETALLQGIEQYLRTTRLPGTAVVLSDFLVPDPVYQRALEALRGRGLAVAALRLIGAGESSPDHLPRRVRLHDVENHRERVVDLTDENRRRYVGAVHSHLERLRRWCEGREIVFAPVDTDRGFEACLFQALPGAGLLI